MGDSSFVAYIWLPLEAQSPLEWNFVTYLILELQVVLSLTRHDYTTRSKVNVGAGLSLCACVFHSFVRFSRTTSVVYILWCAVRFKIIDLNIRVIDPPNRSIDPQNRPIDLQNRSIDPQNRPIDLQNRSIDPQNRPIGPQNRSIRKIDRSINYYRAIGPHCRSINRSKVNESSS